MTVRQHLPATEASWTAISEWQFYLSGDLGYQNSQIRPASLTEPLAVYRDAGRTLCLALIWPETNVSPAQIALTVEIASQYRAEFVAIGPVSDYALYQTSSYGLIPAASRRLPSWVPSMRRNGGVARTHALLPFRDESQLRRAFASCHDVIYKSSATDPAAAFDLLSLVIAAKIIDEQSNSPFYEFSISQHDDDSKVTGRLEQLVRRARQHLALDDGPESWTDIRPIHPQVARMVLEQLQDFSLTLTGASPTGTDILGIAYEQLVGSTFRGELGSYFTPRTLCDFMVRMLNIRSGKLFDPSCGSAGLLIAAHARTKLSQSADSELEVFGNDLNPRMVEAARVNLLVNRLCPSHIRHGDGLDLDSILATWFPDLELRHDTPFWDQNAGPFDFVLANPPFAGFEQDQEILSKFSTSKRLDGTIRSLNKTLPFLELIVATLKEGGRAGIVIPTSILNAEEESFVRFRDLLLKHVRLLAIIGLPEKAFVHTDCGIHGAILFFERQAIPSTDYHIFVGHADHLGYDRLGRPTRENDFPSLVNRFQHQQWLDADQVHISQLVSYGRWDPSWLRIASKLPHEGDADFTSLANLLEIRNARWARKQIQDKEIYSFFEVADTDIHTGEILQVHSVSGFELMKKGRIKQMVHTGDILLPNHRDSLLASSSANGRSVVLVTEEHDGVLTTDRFIVLRPRVDPLLLAAILNSRGIRRQLIAQARGAASLDIRDHTLAKVLVPLSLITEEESVRITSIVRQISALRNELTKTSEQLDFVIEEGFGTAPPITNA